MEFNVVFPNEKCRKTSEKYLKTLSKQDQMKIKETINELAFNPKLFGKKFKTLNPGIPLFNYVAHFRIRVGDHRILYDIDDKSKKIFLLAIRKRSEKTYK